MDKFQDGFNKFMNASRTGEMLEASKQRWLKSSDKGDNLPMELRAAFAAGLYLNILFSTIDRDEVKHLIDNLMHVCMVLDPELFVKNPKVFTNMVATIKRDFVDLTKE